MVAAMGSASSAAGARARLGDDSRRAGKHVFMTPNVQGEAGPTAGRQGSDGENVPRTASRALVARRWASPRPRG